MTPKLLLIVFGFAFAFVAGYAAAHRPAPPLDGCTLLNVRPSDTPEPDYALFEAQIRLSDGRVALIPVAPALAEIHYRGSKAHAGPSVAEVSP